LYDGEQWDYDFDPDINRFSLLFDNLHDLANSPNKDMMLIASETPAKVDTERSLISLLASLAEEGKTTVI
jgi:hypothetical protein